MDYKGFKVTVRSLDGVTGWSWEACRVDGTRIGYCTCKEQIEIAWAQAWAWIDLETDTVSSLDIDNLEDWMDYYEGRAVPQSAVKALIEMARK